MDEVISAYKDGNYVLCLRLAELLLSNNSDNFDVLSYKATCLLKLNQIHEAIATFKKCLKINSRAFHIWVFLGDCYYEIAEYESAADNYKKSLDIEPDNFAALDKLARSLFRLNEIDNAIELMRLVVKKNESVEPHLILMTMYHRSGNIVEALKIAVEGMRKYPEEQRFSKYFGEFQKGNKAQVN